MKCLKKVIWQPECNQRKSDGMNCCFFYPKVNRLPRRAVNLSINSSCIDQVFDHNIIKGIDDVLAAEKTTPFFEPHLIVRHKRTDGSAIQLMRWFLLYFIKSVCHYSSTARTPSREIVNFSKPSCVIT